MKHTRKKRGKGSIKKGWVIRKGEKIELQGERKKHKHRTKRKGN